MPIPCRFGLVAVFVLVLPQTRINRTWGISHGVATLTATLDCGEVQQPWLGTDTRYS